MSTTSSVYVTGARPFIDIDAYAGCIAYAELLQLQGVNAVPFSTSQLNASITPTVLSWGASLTTKMSKTSNTEFVVIDISDPDYLDANVMLESVRGIIDHHTGFETYWQTKRSVEVTIDFVGAACTLVYEAWKNAGLFDQMSQTSARLLATGIIDNTLDFKAKITTNRDRLAYQELSVIGKLKASWPKTYLQECQKVIDSDVARALQNDTKQISYPSLSDSITVGQLAVWDGQSFIASNQQTITQVLSEDGHPWYMNILSIDDSKSIFYTTDHTVQTWLSKSLGITFDGAVAIAPRLWLRKEIMKHVQAKAKHD